MWLSGYKHRVYVVYHSRKNRMRKKCAYISQQIFHRLDSRPAVRVCIQAEQSGTPNTLSMICQSSIRGTYTVNFLLVTGKIYYPFALLRLKPPRLKCMILPMWSWTVHAPARRTLSSILLIYDTILLLNACNVWIWLYNCTCIQMMNASDSFQYRQNSLSTELSISTSTKDQCNNILCIHVVQSIFMDTWQDNIQLQFKISSCGHNPAPILSKYLDSLAKHIDQTNRYWSTIAC